MSVIRISDLSSLEFRNNWKLNDQIQRDYAIKYLASDTITVQFAYESLMNIPTVQIINLDTGSFAYVVINIILVHAGIRVVNATTTDLDTGCYEFQILHGGDIIASSIFKIVDPDELGDSILLEYSNRRHDFNTVFLQNVRYQLRIDGSFPPQYVNLSGESKVFRDQMRSLHHLSGFASNTYTLMFGGNSGAPLWVGDKVNRIFKCTDIYANGERVVGVENSGVSKAISSNTDPLYQFQIEVEKPSENGEYSIQLLDYIKVSSSIFDMAGRPVPESLVNSFIGNRLIASMNTAVDGNAIYQWSIGKSDYDNIIKEIVYSGVRVMDATGGNRHLGFVGAIENTTNNSWSIITQFTTPSILPNRIDGEYILVLDYVQINVNRDDMYISLYDGIVYKRKILPATTYHISIVSNGSSVIVSCNGHSESFNTIMGQLGRDTLYFGMSDEYENQAAIGYTLHMLGIYDSALTPEQLSAIYNFGHPELSDALLKQQAIALWYWDSNSWASNIGGTIEHWVDVFNQYHLVTPSQQQLDSGQLVNWNKFRWLAICGNIASYSEVDLQMFEDAIANGYHADIALALQSGAFSNDYSNDFD